ncbi:MAG TPA: DeoR/GlpR family DNA-binding transcription regulator [Planctomycetota bacterium]|nr:DeoR/GlpR family DNA-binding transcription regulator [Planctomycetota bacterium]
MIAEERRRKLLEFLEKSGSLSVAEVSDQMKVSRMTVHRDLDSLSAAGLLRKVHGGAVPVVKAATTMDDVARSFTERKPANANAKERIAWHLAKILAGARNIACDASTTVFALSITLKPAPENRGMFIVTHGIPLFMELQRKNLGIRIALTGGEPHPRTESLIGPLAIKTLEGLRFDYAVVSAAGLMEEQGEVYDATPEGAAIKQAMLSRANRSILAIDRSKMNFLAPYPLGTLDNFDLVVTEDGPRETKKRRR